MYASSFAPRRRQLLPVRFSLRMLFVAFTATCLGFPIWYRWPYQEDTVHYNLINGKPDMSSPPQSRATTTWQRQWGGNRVKHGLCVIWQSSGDTRIVETYKRGVLDGAYSLECEDGRVQGSYIDGAKTGEWIESSNFPLRRAHSAWRNGRRHGLQTGFSLDGHYMSQFSIPMNDGRLEWTAEICQEHPLLQKVKAHVVDSRRVADALDKPASVALDQQSFRTVIAQLEKAHQIRIETGDGGSYEPFGISSDCSVFNFGPIASGSLEGDLAAVLVMVAQVYGFQCDYRYGCVWLAGRRKAGPWCEPTGISDIVPPPGSRLAQVWEQPIDYSTRDQPIAAVFESLAKEMSVTIDASDLRLNDAPNGSLLVEVFMERFGSGVPVEVTEHPFKHVLGMLLYRTGCRCRLQGDTLLILRPPSWRQVKL